MRKANQTASGSDLSALIRDVRISEHERQAAIHALAMAEAIVDVAVWLKNKAAALGNVFLKLSLKH